MLHDSLLIMYAEHVIYDNSYSYASMALAGACLVALLVRGSIFAARILSNIREGNHWYAYSPDMFLSVTPCISHYL